MGFDTLIVNGRVATATDTYSSDVAIGDGKISALGQSLRGERFLSSNEAIVLGSHLVIKSARDVALKSSAGCRTNKIPDLARKWAAVDAW